MIAYRLNCKNCKLDNTHTTDSLEDAKALWKAWNVKYGKNMKCVHEYDFIILK